MIDAAPPLPASASEAADPAADLLARQLAMLAELAEIAMDVARAVRRQAAEGPAVERGVDLTLAVSRATRAVRLTLMLQTRLLCPPVQGDGQGDALAPRRTVESRKAEAHALIEHFVKEEHGEDEQTVERMMTEAVDRLEVEDDIVNRPLGQIVGLICNDLQLSPWRVSRAMALFDDGNDLANLTAPAWDPLPPRQTVDADASDDPPRRRHRGQLMPPVRPYPVRAAPPDPPTRPPP